jgi:hypothetical protein
MPIIWLSLPLLPNKLRLKRLLLCPMPFQLVVPPCLAKDIANNAINNMGRSGGGSAPAPTPAVPVILPFIHLDNSSKAVSTVAPDKTFAMSIGITSSNMLKTNSSSDDDSNGGIGANGKTLIHQLVGGGGGVEI